MIEVKYGDVWQLGNHRLLCGDCTRPSDVKTLMRGVEADLLITDPPYNLNYEGKTPEKLKIKNDNMSSADFRFFLSKSFFNANEVMKNGASFYVWHAHNQSYNFFGACKDIGWQIRECLIWCKNSLVMGRQAYQWRHEPCLFGWKNGGAHLWNSDRKQTTILEFKRPIASKIHPTMKPIPLFSYLINNSTKENDVVLDIFAGSGTTLMACEQLKRTAYLIEIETGYCNAIIKRFQDQYPNEVVKKIEDNEFYSAM